MKEKKLNFWIKICFEVLFLVEKITSRRNNELKQGAQHIFVF